MVLFLLCGILLMLLPTGEAKAEAVVSEQQTTVFSLEEEERRLEKTLAEIAGVGKCTVLLSVHSGSEAVLARDGEETVVLSGSGEEKTVTVVTRYPEYQGAVVVARGCEDGHVRYDILSAVMAYTGLEVNKITICPMES